MRLMISLLVCLSLSAQSSIVRRGATPAAGGGSSATYRTSSYQNQDASLASIATPGTLNVQSGDLIVVLVGAVNDFGVSTAVCGSDSLTLGPTFYDSGNNYKVSLYYKQNASANAAATCTISFTVAQLYRVIAAANYGGVATSGGVLQSSCNNAGCSTVASASTSRTAQNVTTTTANTVLIAAGVDWDGGNTLTAANGFTLRLNGTTPFLLDKSVTSTGTHPSGNFATASLSQMYVSLFAVFGLL